MRKSFENVGILCRFGINLKGERVNSSTIPGNSESELRSGIVKFRYDVDEQNDKIGIPVPQRSSRSDD